MEAWDSSFFFVPVLLLLSTLAFVVNLVPTLVSGLGVYWQWLLGVEICILWIHFTL